MLDGQIKHYSLIDYPCEVDNGVVVGHDNEVIVF